MSRLFLIKMLPRGGPRTPPERPLITTGHTAMSTQGAPTLTSTGELKDSISFKITLLMYLKVPVES